MSNATIEKKEVILGTSNIVATVLEDGLSNMTLKLQAPNGALAMFRIYYSDTARKNSRYHSWQVHDVYFETVQEVESKTSNSSYLVKHVTDLCLFVERNGQWMLEYIKRELGQM